MPDPAVSPPRIDLRGRDAAGLTRAALDGVLPRAALDVGAAVERVRPICEDVRRRGGAAVREHTMRFDGVDLASTRVPAEALDDALRSLDPAVRDALAEAARRARVVHEAQLPRRADTEPAPGLSVSTRFVPVQRAGVYVPGGLVAYPSSVVMNVVPAQTAGVRSIAVASPPQQESGGLPHPAVLAACALLGVREVHAAGGAQALAMFAYGTAECEPADVITGPGNVYVAAAKRILHGAVGIDGENGPTEIAIIADHTADPAHVAADLIGQAEHDELASCLLITPDPDLPGRVDAELARQLPATRHRERVEAALRGQAGYVLTDDITAALAVSDAWAPEHLEVQTEDAAEVAARVRNAGAVFTGPYSPVSLGDYLAGSNHVLPTGGTARHTSGLSVYPYLKVVNVIECDRDSLAAVAPRVDALGGAEDLAAHVAAVRIRVPADGETR
ncbi:MAG: histidinol dehydrogenase [Streptosporangiaceae bacterium]|nr:histidinol dehydrogenase [Streptosporangiaceae bacterium]MBV9853360.1 histidinol dehydrogenase [Streptosporangiaceae bacterium]